MSDKTYNIDVFKITEGPRDDGSYKGLARCQMSDSVEFYVREIEWFPVAAEVVGETE